MKNVENFTLENYVLASPGIRCVGQMVDFFVSFSIFTLILWGGLEIGTDTLNLEAIGLKADSRGQVKVNETYQTEIDNVYAVGSNQ